jgi:predicted phage terminase large subunit-like protein
MHKAQAEIQNSDARFRVVCCGRRFGKTRLAVTLALAEMLQGGAVLWIAPTHDKAMIGWRLFEELAGQIPGAIIQRGSGRIEYGGGWIAVRSADSEGGLRGEGMSLVVVDEAAHIRELERIWQQEIRPALTDRKGRALFISTPGGFNYFYDLFRMADKDSDWQSWQLPSSANPFLDPAEIESARRELPALVFRQEYGAEFVQLSGAMFRREWFEIVERAPMLNAQARHWDLAATQKTTGDYSAGVKIGMADDGTVYVLDVVYGRWEWPALIRIISQTARADGSAVLQSVETAGVQRGMLDLLRAEPGLADISFRGVTPLADKIARANTWLARAEQGKVKLLRGEWNSAWLDEICAFPEAEHDDIVDATSGAFNSLAKPQQIEYAESIWR